MKHTEKLSHYHKQSKLAHMEKKVLTFLDSSRNRDRTKSYEAIIKYKTDSPTIQLVELLRKTQVLEVTPMTLVSLIGKHLIKINYGRVKLDVSVYYRRSHPALWKAGYFDDVEL